MSWPTERLLNRMTGGSLQVARDEAREAVRLAESTSWHNGVLQQKVAMLEAEKGFGGQGGWQLLGATVGGQWGGLSDAALGQARKLALGMYHHNVWIKRGVNCQVDFVCGQGVSVSSKHTLVNEVLQDFWDDYSNQAELTTPDSVQDKERELQLVGEIFFAFFINTLTGRVQVRTFSPDQMIGDPICNPQDDKEPWYYKRQYQAPTLNVETGVVTSKTVTAYYPDWHYNPAEKPSTIGGAPVVWDAPIYHVRTGSLKRNKRGVPEVLAQMDWAKVYTEFLANRATVARALSRFVMKIKTAVKGTIAGTKAKLAGGAVRRPGQEDLETPLRAGDALIQEPGGDAEPMNVKGATIDPQEGAAFLDAIAAGFGVPSTYFGKVDTGNHATAAALNLVTRLMFDRRRLFWTGVLADILNFVILQAALRPKGKLRGQGRIVWTANTPKVLVKLTGVDGKQKDVPAPLDVDFPPYSTDPVKDVLAAINAAKPNIPDAKLIAKLSLQALGEDDIDEKVAAMTFPDPAQALADQQAATSKSGAQEPTTARL